MSELIPCPFCNVNDWRYQSHFSGASIFQCGGCGAIVDESVINTHPIEDELRALIAELEAEAVKGGIQIEYLNEDELPKHISYKVYSAMYPCSKVDFVRLFPYVTVDGRKRFLIELPEVQE